MIFSRISHFFFFNDTATTEIYTLSLHDALPISLAPDFWLDHSFDRSGVVSHEIFELDLPASRQVQIHINPATPPTSNENSGEGDAARSIYRWDKDKSNNSNPSVPLNAQDVALTTYQ